MLYKRQITAINAQIQYILYFELRNLAVDRLVLSQEKLKH